MVFSEHVLPNLCKHTTKEKDAPQDEDILVFGPNIYLSNSLYSWCVCHLHFSSKFLLHSVLVICLYSILGVTTTHRVCFSQKPLYSVIISTVIFLTSPCLFQIFKLSNLTRSTLDHGLVICIGLHTDGLVFDRGSLSYRLYSFTYPLTVHSECLLLRRLDKKWETITINKIVADNTAFSPYWTQ